MSNQKFIGFSRFIFFQLMLLIALKVHCAVPETATGHTLEVPLQEQIRLAAETGEISLLGSLIDRITDKTAEVLLSAFNAGCKAKRPDALKCLLGRAEFPARDFSKDSDPDLYTLLNDRQDEELLRCLLAKGSVKLHREMVTAIHNAELASRLRLESWNRKTDDKSPLCYVKSPEVAQYLIDRGFSPNGFKTSCSWDNLPLAYVDRADVAQVLIRNGADFRMPKQFNFQSEESIICSWDQHPLLKTRSLEVAQLLISEDCGWELPDWHENYSITEPLKNPDLLKLLLEQGMPLNITDCRDEPILFQYTSLTVETRMLLAHGADPKARMPIQADDILGWGLHRHMDSAEMESDLAGKLGYTLLHCARNEEFVRLMLDSGLDPNQRGGKRGETPLHTVSDPGALSALIEAGADVNARDDLGNTPLFNIQLKPEGLKILLSHGADPDALNNQGQSALDVHFGDKCRDLLKTCSKIRIKAQTETSVKEDFSPSSVLYYLRHENGLTDEDKIYRIRRCLAQSAVKVNEDDCREFLRICPRPETARMLEQKGFELKRDIFEIMVDAVSGIGHADLVRYLLETRMPDLMMCEKGYKLKDGRVARQPFLLFCRSEYIDMLVKAGFSPDSASLCGITPLMEAALNFTETDSYRRLEKLIATGADVNLVSEGGYTVLHHLVLDFTYNWSGNDDSAMNSMQDYALRMLNLLRQAGADPRIRDNQGRTALEMFRNDCSDKGVPEEGRLLEMMKLLE
ncbi:MAG: ankyrin repeat domain-containing protein [Candidatus Wallbacteria bacterium]|nr:ankyrin repeat domain-containing protein [Candidatus Wallbacteria bacterium]